MARGIQRRAHLHCISIRLVPQSGQYSAQALPVLLIQHVVGIQPHDPATGGVAHRFVAGGSKTVHPGKAEDLRPKADSYVPGAIG
jgi:hypothetical protein